MIISESAVVLGAEHARREISHSEEKLTVWLDRPAGSGGQPVGGQTAVNPANQVSAAVVELSSSSLEQARRTQPSVEKTDAGDEFTHDLNIMILKDFIERITGKKIKLETIKDFTAEAGPATEPAAKPVENSTAQPGFGMIYEHHQSYREEERLAVTAEGRIITADGKELAFSTSLTMSRSFVEENNLTIRAGAALKDPLVINYDGSAPELEKPVFQFDIDSDGTRDQLHFVSRGSGFLAHDLNRDGVVNDGRELFGAETGDGFAELSRYDQDDNGWIDEQDEIYRNLRIWHRDQDGSTKLAALGQMGVGAIYLGQVESPFALKDEANNLQAQIRETGIFLRENGTAGTVQQLDLVV